MTTQEALNKVLKYAQEQVGYKATSDKRNKYAQELDAVGWFNGRKNGFDWCCCFVTDLFYHCFGNVARKMLFQPEPAYDYAAACGFAVDYYINNNSWSKNPVLGSQIFFGVRGDEYHTGIVYDFDGTYVYTIEGNAGGGGGQVMKRRYYRNSGISGYGIPKWSLVSNSSDPIPTPTPSTPTTPAKTDYDKVKEGTVYTVKSGDTLSAIAVKYGTTVANLVKINGIKNPNFISVGQKIVIKEAEKASTSKTVEQIAKEVIDGKWGNGAARVTALKNAGYNPTDVQNKVNELLSQKVYYTVKSGDTLTAIAKKYGTTVDKLVALNKIKNKNLINVGQILRVK